MGEVAASHPHRPSGPAHTGERIPAVVNIGIGGSDLGPAMAYEALRDYADPDIDCRFVSNIDPVDLYNKTHDLDPAETLFVVSSKTFTTLETLTNATAARQWLLDGLGAGDEAVARHFVAVSTNEEGVSRVRHRPGQHVRVLGLGRRPLLVRLGHRLLAHGGHRSGRLRRHAGRLPRHRPALRHRPARGQHAGHPGHAQRLVRQPLRRRDPRRAALQPAPGPLPRLPAAADHGVERQVGAPGRLPGVGPDRGDLLGRARHQRPARLLPAHPPGHQAHPGRLHRLRRVHPRARRPAGPAHVQLLRPVQGAGLRPHRRGGGRRGHPARPWCPTR